MNSAFFLGNNYGDKIMKVTGKDGRTIGTKHVNNRQATQYVPTIEAFEDHHWDSILKAVREVLSEGSKRKRSKSMSSRVSSDFDIEDAEDEENYIYNILISDDE